MKIQWTKKRLTSERAFWPMMSAHQEQPFFAILDIGPRWLCATWSFEPSGAQLPDLSTEQTPFPFPTPIGSVGWISYEAAAQFEPSFAVKELTPTLELFQTEGALIFDRETHVLHTVGTPDFIRQARKKSSSSIRSPRLKSAQESADLILSQKKDFIAGVQKLKQEIQAGSLYQCNLSWKTPHFDLEDGLALWLLLRKENPAYYGAYLRANQQELICNSPEQFLSIQHEDDAYFVSSSPIKGTAHIMEGIQGRLKLWHSLKERAELTMVVDMVRNDLGRVALPGTVLTTARRIRKCGDLYHAEQTVKAQLATRSTEKIFSAAFPPASITGAPKHAAMEWINRLEPHTRGSYTGSIGYVDLWGNAHWNVAIRTIQAFNQKAHFHVGCGIVYDSDPELEWEESLSKSKAIMRCLGKNWI